MKRNIFTIFVLISFQSILRAQSIGSLSNAEITPSLFYNAIGSDIIDNLNQSVFLGFDKSIPLKDSNSISSFNLRGGPTIAATKSDNPDKKSAAKQLLLPSNLAIATMIYYKHYLDSTKEFCYQFFFDMGIAVTRIGIPEESNEKATIWLTSAKLAVGVNLLKYFSFLIAYRLCDYGIMGSKREFSNVFQTDKTWSHEMLFGISYYLESNKTNLYADYRIFLAGALPDIGISDGVASFGISKEIKLSSLLGLFE